MQELFSCMLQAENRVFRFRNLQKENFNLYIFAHQVYVKEH